jgi:hypothetical protein
VTANTAGVIGVLVNVDDREPRSLNVVRGRVEHRFGFEITKEQRRLFLGPGGRAVSLLLRWSTENDDWYTDQYRENQFDSLHASPRGLLPCLGNAMINFRTR